MIFGFSRFSGLASSMIYVRTERHLFCFSSQKKLLYRERPYRSAAWFLERGFLLAARVLSPCATEFYLNSSGANS